MTQRKQLNALPDRGPLRVMFVITSMPVGGAETLLVNLVRRLDRERFRPELCCLKEPGPLGEILAEEVPIHSRLLTSKFDLRVFTRLTQLLARQRTDAVISVGAGDKMFWGRLAARRAGVPVILSALHSTGWPDSIGVLNRLLTPVTDGFIAVAQRHGRHLVEQERFPQDKVFVVPNGVDTERFAACRAMREKVRERLGIGPEAPTCGIVAALRPEKNHELFLRTAAQLRSTCPDARFLIIGDGPQRTALESLAAELGLERAVQFLGSRNDISELLTALDVFTLTSHNEANPVSILEAMATSVPVVATNVGSVSEAVRHGETGFLAPTGDVDQIAGHWNRLFAHPIMAHQMGRDARKLVEQKWSLVTMVNGYEKLIEQVYSSKAGSSAVPVESTVASSPASIQI